MADRETFTTMYTREGQPVLHFLARRTFDAALATDLTAETFALAFGSWPRLSGRSEDEVRAWLYTVARRQVSRLLRDRVGLAGRNITDRTRAPISPAAPMFSSASPARARTPSSA